MIDLCHFRFDSHLRSPAFHIFDIARIFNHIME